MRSKFRVYKFLVFSEILIHSFNHLLTFNHAKSTDDVEKKFLVFSEILIHSFNHLLTFNHAESIDDVQTRRIEIFCLFLDNMNILKN